MIFERLHIHQHRNARAVGLFYDKLGGNHALAAAHRLCDRRRIEVEWLAIGPVASEIAAEMCGRFAERKFTAP